MAKSVTLSSGSPLLPDVGMSQSSLMVAALVGGFVVYLALAGKLGAYWSILIGGGASATSSAAPTTTAPSTTAPSTTTPPTVGSTNPDGSTTIIPPLISGVPNSGLTFKWTNPFGPGGVFGPPATTTTPPATTPAPATGSP